MRSESRWPHRRARLPLAAAGVAVVCALGAARAHAQTTATDSSAASSASLRTPGRVERRQALTLQPIVGLAGLLSVDYERGIGGGFSLGLGGSYWDTRTLGFGDLLRAKYGSAELKGRFYPGGRPLHGLSIAATVGGARAAYHVPDYIDVDPDERHVVTYGVKLGTELDYNWLVGPKQRFAFALGVGAKRIFYQDPVGSGDHLAGTYPTSRIAIGYAF